MSRAKCVTLALFVAFGTPTAHALPFTESWYMGRGESNLEIGNYKAAIEAFEKVVEKNPGNSQARKKLAQAYEGQGLKDKAVAAYDRYLEQNSDDADVAFKQAETLGWSRYRYRRKDALKYYEMGLRKKDDPKMRLRYAKLLSASRDTTPQAIEQYQKVLRREPNNAEAHRGLAKSYAWTGENDKALYHSKLAQKAGSTASDLENLDRDLGKGREPMAGGRLAFLVQPNEPFDLMGFELGAVGRYELTPFVSAYAQMGFEDYWNSDHSSAGAKVEMEADARLSESQEIKAALEYHSLRPVTSAMTDASTSAGLRNLGLRLEFEYQDGTNTITPAFRRELRYDSFLALAGSRTVGDGLGAARSNLFLVELSRKVGSEQRLKLSLTPLIGWVSALSAAPNLEMGLNAEALYSFSNSGMDGNGWGLFYAMETVHYSADRSSFGGNGGGYFSPQFFTSHSPGLSYTNSSGSAERHLELKIGPSFQYSKDSTESGFQIGARFDGSYVQRFGQRTQLRTSAGFTRVSSLYNRFHIESTFGYLF